MHDEVTMLSAESTLAHPPWVTPMDPRMLRAWVKRELDVSLADRPLIDGHASPLDYLAHVFFEGAFTRAPDHTWSHAPADAPGGDCILWANRGGGKTFLGAIATLLDLVFRPAVQVRVLAGSLEQSQRMHAYLRSLLDRPRIAAATAGAVTVRETRAASGACARVLAASQASVRGTRVQKIRCDEVDLFHPELWRAAQMVTRSVAACPGPWGSRIAGSVEALSTMHRPHGLMWDLVHAATTDRAAARPVFRWGVVDVLETCPPSRPCEPCGLWNECAGRAKSTDRAGGHITIDDAIVQKSRVHRAAWESEMLCLRPRSDASVYPEFDPARHVIADGHPLLADRRVTAFYAAMDFGIRSESVVLLASLDDRNRIVVERESIAAGQPLPEQIAVLDGWIAAAACRDLSRPAAVVIDPAGMARSDQTGASNASVLRAAGHRVAAARAGIHAGIRLVRHRLAPALSLDHAPGAAPDPAPTLFIHARCTRLIECVQRYHYPENRPRIIDPVKDGFDHACDALRYLVTALDAGSEVRIDDY